MSLSLTLQQQIVEKINKLLNTAGDAHRLIFQTDHGDMVLGIKYQTAEIDIYAAAGRSLARRLSAEHAQYLHEMGYRRKTAADVFHKKYTLNSSSIPPVVDHTFLAQWLPILQELYLINPSSLRIKSRRNTWIELDDSSWLEMIKKISQKKDHSTRQKLYWAFVRSQFLLALDRKVDRDLIRSLPTMSPRDQMQVLPGLLKYHVAADIQHYRASVAFSSMQALHNYDVSLLPHIQLSGRVLASILVQDKLDSLVINPRNDTGGEFYKNELISIDDAMKNWDQK